MHERQLLRMKQHGIQAEFLQKELVLLVAAVRAVADDGVEDVCHVFA